VATLAGQWSVRAQEVAVIGRVLLLDPTARGKRIDQSNTVVWLTPLGVSAALPARVPAASPRRFRLVQKNKRFTPHLLVVPVGSRVEFPNLDPLLHNVFSLFDGKRFDLGLYEAGTTRTVSFSAVGISYVFCNIHPEMSAVVIVLKTPFYGISNTLGEVSIGGVPPGRYEVNVWQERCLPDSLKGATREVAISGYSPSLGEIRLAESGNLLKDHKNLYGRDYEGQSSQPYELP
jgi:plastocyanin